MTSDPLVAFADADYIVLFGAFPRTAGMQRLDLLQKNKAIFKEQGLAFEQVGKPSCKVLVVGNPANTNAFIFSHFCPKLPKENVTALARLDHNRTVAQISQHLNVWSRAVGNVFVMGNHSATMVPVF